MSVKFYQFSCIQGYYQTNSIWKCVWIVYNFLVFLICQRSCRISVLCAYFLFNNNDDVSQSIKNCRTGRMHATIYEIVVIRTDFMWFSHIFYLRSIKCPHMRITMGVTYFTLPFFRFIYYTYLQRIKTNNLYQIEQKISSCLILCRVWISCCFLNKNVSNHQLISILFCNP